MASIMNRVALRRSLNQMPRPQTGPRITKRHNQNHGTPSPQPQQQSVKPPISNAATNSGTSIPVPSTVAALPLWQRLGPLTRLFQAYARVQRKRPYTTQFCSSLVIYFMGDLSAQSIAHDGYDPRQTGRALLISAGCSIATYKWFLFLGSCFNYPSRVLSLGTKVIVNQIVFTPIFNSYFFGMQSVLANLPNFDLAATWEHISRTVPRSYVNSLKLWPAVTAFSFTFIAPQYRSIFAGIVAIGWQTYLSYLNHQVENLEAIEHGAEGTLHHKPMLQPESAPKARLEAAPHAGPDAQIAAASES